MSKLELKQENLVDDERKERIGHLAAHQARIALMAIAQVIEENCHCDTISFEQALDIAETF